MNFTPPKDWNCLTTIDAHVAGEPLRVVTGGYPELVGDTMLAKRRCAREQHDTLRRALMLEPRGHADMYGCILTPPVTPDGDVGVLFLHNEGYSTMCGHGIIGLVTVGLETGLLARSVDARTGPVTVRIDSPAGRVTASAELSGQFPPRVGAVSFENVPSFVLRRDAEVELDGVGRVRYDLAYGGAFYACVDAEALGLTLEPTQFSRIVELGMRIKRAVMGSTRIEHPTGDPDLGFLYGTIFVGPSSQGHHSQNVCVFAEGEVDRSPTGTGVSARAALHHARGELSPGEWITIESLVGTSFDVRVREVCRVGDVAAVVPEVRGRAHLTGRHEFWIDPQDPLRAGFLAR